MRPCGRDMNTHYSNETVDNSKDTSQPLVIKAESRFEVMSFIFVAET